MGGDDSSLRVRSASRSIALAILLIMASFVLVKTGRDALYVQERGVFDLPIAYVAMAAFSLPVAIGMLWLIHTAGPRRARALALAGVTGVVAVFWRTAEPGGGARMTAMFVAVPLLYGVLFAAVWLLAAELFDGLAEERVSRAYARIGAGSIAGGLLGGIAARALAPAVPPEDFFGLGALVLGVSVVVVVLTQARHEPRPTAGEATPRPRPGRARSFLRRRYGVLLLGTGVLGAVAGVLVEFQFYWAASTSGASAREQSLYFANLYLLLNAAALTVQLVVMPGVQRRLGIAGSLLVMPAMLLGGAVLLVFGAGLAARGALRITEGGLKASIHRASWEQAFLPAGPERDVAKLVVDGMGAHLGAGLVAAPLYLWLHTVVGNDPLTQHSGAWITWLLMATTAALIGTTRLLSPWLGGRRGRGDRHGISSLPPGGCVVTATLGRIVQEECRRRRGEDRRPAHRCVASVANSR